VQPNNEMSGDEASAINGASPLTSVFGRRWKPDWEAKRMTRHFTFRSTQFENKSAKPHFINERCFGEDLAKWLRDGLDVQFKADEVIQEDYGWGFWTQIGGDPYWVYVGVMDDSIGQDTAEWLVGVAYDPGLNIVRRLFRKPKLDDLLALCRAVDNRLQRSAGHAANIEWWQHEPQTGTPSAHPE